MSKNPYQTLFVLCLAFIYSCKSPAHNSTDHVTPGTVIDSLSVPVKDDTLNKSVFSVRIVADSAVENGVYIVDVTFGSNFAQGKFTMPKGIEHVTPILRLSSAPYTCVVGFKLENDTSFNGYFEISSNKQNTRMGYINSYTFQ